MKHQFNIVRGGELITWRCRRCGTKVINASCNLYDEPHIVGTGGCGIMYPNEPSLYQYGGAIKPCHEVIFDS